MGSPTGASYESLLEARHLLSLHFTGLAHSEVIQRAHTVFGKGDKNGKLLAMLVVNYHSIQCRIPCSHIVPDQAGSLKVKVCYWQQKLCIL